MGLDGVELIMGIEEEFGISISDAEADNADTVEKVVNLVFSKLKYDPESVCPSQHNFYIVRKKLMEKFDLPRDAIKPDTLLEKIIPRVDRRKRWKEFTNNISEVTLKGKLVRARWLHNLVFFYIPAISFIAVLWWLSLCQINGVLLFSALFVIMFLVFVTGAIVTIPFKIHFPSKDFKIKDMLPGTGHWCCKTVTKEEVFEKVKEITVEQLGVAPEQVKLESHWVNDLGVG